MAESAIREQPTPPTVEDTAREIVAQARRAVASGAPVFFLVVYDHERLRLELIINIRRDLAAIGISTQLLDPRHRSDHSTGNLYEALESSGGRCISLLSNLPLDPGGIRYDSEFLTYLNLHRDRISQRKLRLVLFLPSDAIETFIRLAGDLWDYRQHTWWLESEVPLLPIDFDQLRQVGGGEGAAPPIVIFNANNGRPLIVPSGDQQVALGVFPKTRLISKHVSQGLPLVERGEATDSGVLDLYALVERTPDVVDRAHLLLGLSSSLLRRFAAPEALEVAREGLLLGEDVGPRTRAGLLHAAGNASRALGRPLDAIPHFEESLRILQDLSERGFEASVLSDLALTYEDLGDLSAALRLHRSSLDKSRELGDLHSEARALNNLANIYKAEGQVDEALLLFGMSLALAREIGDLSGKAGVMNNIALIYLDRGKAEAALSVFEALLTVYEGLGNRKGEVMTSLNRAIALLALGRLGDAQEAMERSLENARRLGDRRTEAAAFLNLAHLFEVRGEVARATDLLAHAVEIEREIASPDLAADEERLAALRSSGVGATN